MEWAVVLEGQTGPESILVLLDERQEAESIATELLKKGYRVVVRLCQSPGARWAENGGRAEAAP
jgi:hypothetical protein